MLRRIIALPSRRCNPSGCWSDEGRPRFPRAKWRRLDRKRGPSRPGSGYCAIEWASTVRFSGGVPVSAKPQCKTEPVLQPFDGIRCLGPLGFIRNHEIRLQFCGQWNRCRIAFARKWKSRRTRDIGMSRVGVVPSRKQIRNVGPSLRRSARPTPPSRARDARSGHSRPPSREPGLHGPGRLNACSRVHVIGQHRPHTECRTQNAVGLV